MSNNNCLVLRWILIFVCYNVISIEALLSNLQRIPPTDVSSLFTPKTMNLRPLGGSTSSSTTRAFADNSKSSTSSDIVPPPPSSSTPLNINSRGRVNEIDFCMAPSDVSLSRYYKNDNKLNKSYTGLNSGDSNKQVVSLTRALNNASNRAVRRILLSRSWPSSDALNLSLRQYLSSSPSTNEKSESFSKDQEGIEAGSIKCPVPRPILNIIMRRSNDFNSIDDSISTPQSSKSFASGKASKQGRTDKEWVNDQILALRESYGELPGYYLAEAYLECILSLATSGIESPKVYEVLAGEVYDESYRRFISVLKSVGTVFTEVESSETPKQSVDHKPPLKKIAPKLVDQDICLSMLDKIAIRQEEIDQAQKITTGETETEISSQVENKNEENEIIIDNVTLAMGLEDQVMEDEECDEEKRFKLPFFFMSKKKKSKQPSTESISAATNTNRSTMNSMTKGDGDLFEEEKPQIQPRDLGAVLLSAEEPSMTRQLNILANVVQRALLFGGDQELLVLSETLEADKPAFVQRWYPGSFSDQNVDDDNLINEKRPGVQFLNCLVKLMKQCYSKGIVVDLEPPFPLVQSYRNAYERLTASLVELGSGYIKPLNRRRDLIIRTIPKTPQEEFGRFAEWEVNIRQTSPDVNAYPDDLIGEWEVQDEIGGKTIGVSTVFLASQGEVLLKPPLTGLRWRLDPGPTHLDTCTFQFLSDDGDIFQYKGFIDRGARLESRFSKRPIKIRGAVAFQMRDGEVDFMSRAYKKDMLPLDVKTGTTRFVMTKSVEGKNQNKQ